MAVASETARIALAPEAALVARPVEVDHGEVDRALVLGLVPLEGVVDLSVDVADGRRDALAVPLVAAVAQLDGLVEPVDAPEGEMARPIAPDSRWTSASTVGFPLESRTWRPRTTSIALIRVSFVRRPRYSAELPTTFARRRGCRRAARRALAQHALQVDVRVAGRRDEGAERVAPRVGGAQRPGRRAFARPRAPRAARRARARATRRGASSVESDEARPCARASRRASVTAAATRCRR